MNMCSFKGILDTLSRDMTLNAELAVCFIQLYCPILSWFIKYFEATGQFEFFLHISTVIV